MKQDHLRLFLKDRYDIAVGEKTLEELKKKITKVLKTRIKISGRSYKTGKKKMVNILVNNLLTLWKI